MSKRMHGASLYYASDKNVFDALNQHKVDIPTITRLFQRRNIIVSKKSRREELAEYFARLTHDYYDHKEIAARLGVAPRRERITSMDIVGAGDTDGLQAAAEQLKSQLEASGDTVQIARSGDNLTLNVQYSKMNYKLSEFAQVQVRDGTVEFVKSVEGFIVRNTQNEYLNDVRDTLLKEVEKVSDTSVTKITVSLFDIPSPKLRSKFFHELMTNLPGFVRLDVSDVHVYKAKPSIEGDDEQETRNAEDQDTHVERVLLKGNGVTRSELLNALLDEDDYYIIKIDWTATETMGEGNVYDIEAVFSDPKDCSGFSFILNGVFPLEEGTVSSRRRAPYKNEIDRISHAIELKSRELVIKLRGEVTANTVGDT
jgi:hypothetical protein